MSRVLGQSVLWLVVAFCWLYVFTYSRGLSNPNERTRVLQVRAVVEQGRLSIGETFRDGDGRLRVRDLYGQAYTGPFVNDLALVCDDPSQSPPDCVGRLYPAKAPGATLLAVPIFAAARRVGVIADGPDAEPRATWLLRVSTIIPLTLLGLAALLALLARAGLDDRATRLLLVATALGTTLFPYGIMFVGHAAASACIVVSLWALASALETDGRAGRWAVLAGCTAAFAVLLEYHAVVAVLCVAAWVVLSPARRRLLPGFAASSVALAAVFMGLHQVMFRAPWRTGHAFLFSVHNQESQSTGFLGLSHPHLGSLGDHLGDLYMGLFPLMPWLAVAGAIGIVIMARRRVGTLPIGLTRTAAAIIAGYLLFAASLDKWRMMNGWSIGPRYLVPALFPMALAGAIGWARLRAWRPWAGQLVVGLMAASVLMVGALTVSFPQPPASLSNPLSELAMPLLTAGCAPPNLGRMVGLESWSLVPVLGVIGLVAMWMCFVETAGGWRRRAGQGAIAAVLALLWFGVMAGWRVAEPERQTRWVRYAVERLENGCELTP